MRARPRPGRRVLSRPTATPWLRFYGIAVTARPDHDQGRAAPFFGEQYDQLTDPENALRPVPANRMAIQPLSKLPEGAPLRMQDCRPSLGPGDGPRRPSQQAPSPTVPPEDRGYQS